MSSADPERWSVRVEPAGFVIGCGSGETIFLAAARLGIRWPTICGGLARCGQCHVQVVRSERPLPEVGHAEAAGLRMAPDHLHGDASVRLACQMPVETNLVVRRYGVEPPEGFDRVR